MKGLENCRSCNDIWNRSYWGSSSEFLGKEQAGPDRFNRDALLVVNALQKNIHYQLEVGSILEACRTELWKSSSIGIIHAKKPVNKAAHLMARVSCSLNGCNILGLLHRFCWRHFCLS